MKERFLLEYNLLLENYIKLTEMLLRTYSNLRIFLLGKEKKFEIDISLRRKFGRRIINTMGRFDLDELVAFISFLDIMIGPDSGPIYIAEALGKFTIDITGPVDEKEQAPISKKNFVIFDKRVNCRPCSFVMNTAYRCKKGTLECLKNINPADIVKLFSKIYPLLIREKTRADLPTLGERRNGF